MTEIQIQDNIGNAADRLEAAKLLIGDILDNFLGNDNARKDAHAFLYGAERYRIYADLALDQLHQAAQLLKEAQAE